jgi:hypothetical protein
MSMYRQLWLAVIVSMLVALAGSLLASSLSARAYLSEQLTLKNDDNAAALALSLSTQGADAVAVELAVSALFDSGHYELIRVVDPLGKVLVERRMAPGNYGAPAWFARLLPIESRPGQAHISSGWKQLGTVELVSNSRFAYDSLWHNVWELAAALFLATLVGGYLGTLILRRLRAPLLAVIGQARAITERRFTTIEEPDVPELRQLATAMNATVGRLKGMFEEEKRPPGRDAPRGELRSPDRPGEPRPFPGAPAPGAGSRRIRAASADSGAGGGPGRDQPAAGTGCHRRAAAALCRRPARRPTAQQAESLVARLNGADFALL